MPYAPTYETYSSPAQTNGHSREFNNLVHTVAKAYEATATDKGIDPQDLIQQANIAFLRATQRPCDPLPVTPLPPNTRNIIHAEMRRNLAKAPIIRIPNNKISDITKIRKRTRPENIPDVLDDKARLKGLKVRTKNVRDLRLSFEAQNIRSLDEVFIIDEEGIKERTTQHEAIADETALPPDAEICRRETYEIALSVIKGLPEKVRDTLYRRFGFEGYEPQSQEEIAKHYGNTHQNICALIKRTKKLIKGRLIGAAKREDISCPCFKL